MHDLVHEGKVGAAGTLYGTNEQEGSSCDVLLRRRAPQSAEPAPSAPALDLLS